MLTSGNSAQLSPRAGKIHYCQFFIFDKKPKISTKSVPDFHKCQRFFPTFRAISLNFSENFSWFSKKISKNRTPNRLFLLHFFREWNSIIITIVIVINYKFCSLYTMLFQCAIQIKSWVKYQSCTLRRSFWVSIQLKFHFSFRNLFSDNTSCTFDSNQFGLILCIFYRL